MGLIVILVDLGWNFPFPFLILLAYFLIFFTEFRPSI